MPINILMPALSPTMTEGNLAKWLKSEGDPVEAGEVIAEIETDKATMEVEAVDEGVLGRIVVPEGSEGVAVNAVIGVLLAEGEDAGSIEEAPAPAEKPEPVAEPAPEAPPAPGVLPKGLPPKPAGKRESPRARLPGAWRHRRGSISLPSGAADRRGASSRPISRPRWPPVRQPRLPLPSVCRRPPLPRRPRPKTERPGCRPCGG